MSLFDLGFGQRFSFLARSVENCQRRGRFAALVALNGPSVRHTEAPGDEFGLHVSLGPKESLRDLFRFEAFADVGEWRADSSTALAELVGRKTGKFRGVEDMDSGVGVAMRMGVGDQVCSKGGIVIGWH